MIEIYLQNCLYNLPIHPLLTINYKYHVISSVRVFVSTLDTLHVLGP